MAFYLKLYFATLMAFFVIDVVWLGLVARSFYSRYLGFLMAPSTNWLAAIIFYCCSSWASWYSSLCPGWGITHSKQPFCGRHLLDSLHMPLMTSLISQP